MGAEMWIERAWVPREPTVSQLSKVHLYIDRLLPEQVAELADYDGERPEEKYLAETKSRLHAAVDSVVAPLAGIGRPPRDVCYETFGEELYALTGGMSHDSDVTDASAEIRALDMTGVVAAALGDDGQDPLFEEEEPRT